jgi:hypothetical protein
MNDNTITEAQVRNQYGIMYDSLPRDSYTLALFKKMSELKSFMEVYEQGFVVYKSLSKSTSQLNGLSSEQIRIALAFVRDEVTPEEFNPIFELPDLIETAMLENEQEEIKLTSLGFRAVDGRRPEIERDLYIIGLVDSLLLHQEKKVSMAKIYRNVALVLLTDDIRANAKNEAEIQRVEFILKSSDMIINERLKDVSLLTPDELDRHGKLGDIVGKTYRKYKKNEK